MSIERPYFHGTTLWSERKSIYMRTIRRWKHVPGGVGLEPFMQYKSEVPTGENLWTPLQVCRGGMSSNQKGSETNGL